RVRELAAADRIACCDLDRESQFRVSLVKVAADRFHLIVTMHHIVIDGWSLPILLEEIFLAYGGETLATPMPYRGYLAWVSEQDAAASSAVWREQFAGFESPTIIDPLGIDSASERIPADRASQGFSVPETTTRALDALVRELDTTMSTVLHAAWSRVLSVMTGRSDVVFGTTVSGRPAELPGIDKMVGLFINTIPVRADIEHDTTFAQLVERLQQNQTDTVEHQFLPLTEICRASGQQHLFDTLMVYENYPIEASAENISADISITDISVHETVHYPLALQISPGPRLHLQVKYSTDVLDAVAVEQLAARFLRVLDAIIADPRQQVSSIEVFDEHELAQLAKFSNRA
ncbi:condensation domain-containing protein, partial [Nocardia sp. NPDC059195]